MAEVDKGSGVELLNDLVSEIDVERVFQTPLLESIMKNVILPDVVDEEQSAFFKGRLITDNSLIAMECFHWLNKKVKGKRGTMALKMDMAKAYDKMEWAFIRGVLQSMGFPERILQLIMSCISTVSYQILINDQPNSSFSPNRGIRQGDLLSPSFFCVLMSCLVCCIKRLKAKPFTVSKWLGMLPKSHISCLRMIVSSLQEPTKMNEANTIIQVLNKYQLASEKNIICNKIEVKPVTSHSRYLGLPVIFGRSKKEVFAFVQDKIWKKVKGWKEKCLSKAGKETLIKVVAQAIPNYIMSCYKIPEGSCANIESMLSKFWLMSNEDSLLSRVFKSKYFPRSCFLKSKCGYQPSYAWRSLFNAKSVIDLGLRWTIGNGQQVKIWKDSWLPELLSFKVWSPVCNLDEDAVVAELIDVDLKKWKRELVMNSLNEFEANQILNISLS
ncbi:uncharacterized protein LOC123892085 [Trifolium pratense]|uniref:uncharacterized protein LOC123892085 n=1 Tax=Trifolium pratense TaxID=57577 RepID=UPI001E692969|nr:uncharacterized protein LOC123892085 [Trifolium pratense]